MRSGRRSAMDIFRSIFGSSDPRHVMIGGILILALFAFELFNFDTTRYALTNLLGDVTFAGIGWAAILAVAFCAIDFAGLARLFTPERGRNEPQSVWYLMGAWLLGATMNAVMTWWAVSLTLLNHNLGNEVLGREQLLKFVPIFVAVLVWLTRILFIGSLTVAGEQFLDSQSDADSSPQFNSRPARQPVSRPRPGAAVNGSSRRPAAPRPSAGSRIKRPASAMVGFNGGGKPAGGATFAPAQEQVTAAAGPVREPGVSESGPMRRRPPIMSAYPNRSGRSMQGKGHD